MCKEITGRDDSNSFFLEFVMFIICICIAFALYWTVTPETPNRQFTGIVRHTMALIDKTNEGELRIEFNIAGLEIHFFGW